MMNISKLLLLILSFLVTSIHSVKVCDAMRCRRKGMMRPGRRPVTPAEVPYLAVFLYENERPPHRPYCIGVFIAARLNLRGYTTRESVVLTSCVCSQRETKVLIGIRSSYGYQLEHLKTYTVKRHQLSPKCSTQTLDDPYDFAYLVGHERFPDMENVYFKSSSMDIYTDYINSLMQKHESECFAFGYGGFEFLSHKQGPPEKEGLLETTLHIYDYRLITDEECVKYVPKCCGKWSDIGTRTEAVKDSKLHCAIRGMPNSYCYGNTGSPIICDGFLIGLLKGHLKCSPDNENYAGPDIYNPIGRNYPFQYDLVNLPSSMLRPKPPFFQDSISELEFELEEIYTDGNSSNSTTGGTSNNTKTNKNRESEDDYYYDFATPNFFSSLPTIVIATILEFILY